jgi:hypothetical protein
LRPQAGDAQHAVSEHQQLGRDVLHPVMSMLDARSLVMCALSCRWWAESAAYVLLAKRLEKAKVSNNVAC